MNRELPLYTDGDFLHRRCPNTTTPRDAVRMPKIQTRVPQKCSAQIPSL